LYAPDHDGKGFMFHPAPAPFEEDIETIVEPLRGLGPARPATPARGFAAPVERASKRILRFLQRRGVITLVTAPGDGEVTVVTDETMGDKDPLLARLLAAATAGAPVPSGPRAYPPNPCPTRSSRAPVPAGPANKRKPLRIVLDPDAHPVGKGNLCGQHRGFNLHGATKVAANDAQGRLALCKYVLRPPLANDRLAIIDDDHVRLDFKKPWSDGDGRGEAAWGRGWVGGP
jgi:hypothetical protein